MAKAAGNYSNAALIKMEAQANGYAEAVALDASTGMVSEGSGQNIFVVKVFASAHGHALLRISTGR